MSDQLVQHYIVLNKYLQQLSITLLLGVSSTLLFAYQTKDCIADIPAPFAQKICALSNNAQQYKQLNKEYQQMQEAFLATQLISNVPLYFLVKQQQYWQKYVLTCPNRTCLEKHLVLRKAQLLHMMTINQSLNQHYMSVQYSAKNQQFQFVDLQIQQLEKNRIKIEAKKYQNPQQDLKQMLSLNAYSFTHQLHQIQDLDSQCQYQLQRLKYGIRIKTNNKQKVCQHFVGLYKLYD